MGCIIHKLIKLFVANPVENIEAMTMNDTEAIFTIVLRNLNLVNWIELLPEAQRQMIEEVADLIKCDVLPLDKKQQLGKRLDKLQSYVTQIHRERISQILALLEQLSLETKNCA